MCLKALLAKCADDPIFSNFCEEKAAFDTATAVAHSEGLIRRAKLTSFENYIIRLAVLKQGKDPQSQLATRKIQFEANGYDSSKLVHPSLVKPMEKMIRSESQEPQKDKKDKKEKRKRDKTDVDEPKAKKSSKKT